MAEEIDDDPWLDQLREALADVSDARDERPALGEPTMPEGEVDWSSIEPADEPTPLPPPELVDDALARQPAAVALILPEVDHDCCWEEIWPDALVQLAGLVD